MSPRLRTLAVALGLALLGLSACRKSVQNAKDLKRLPNVFLGEQQVESLRFEWTDKGTGDHFDSILANHAGVAASLSFSVSAGRHQKEPDLFDSVLASVQWLV